MSESLGVLLGWIAADIMEPLLIMMIIITVALVVSALIIGCMAFIVSIVMDRDDDVIHAVPSDFME